MNGFQRIAFIFPGQGAQYPGMGKDFFESFAVAKQTLEEANDTLGRNIAEVILQGPEETLTQTRNSQTGIYIVSMAVLRTLETLFPDVRPFMTAGLSLGEYTAATAAGCLDYTAGLPLVQCRGELMNEACERTDGAMAVILGLEAATVEELVRELAMPDDLWAANFNCPGQVVISGTQKGIEAGSRAAKEKGAKRVMPLQVHGAFHSGLMRHAETGLAQQLEETVLHKPKAALVMNVTGAVADTPEEIRDNLVRQVTSPVRWEQGVRAMMQEGVDLFIEMGPGKTLAGFNKRMKAPVPTVSIETTDDMNKLETTLAQGVTG